MRGFFITFEGLDGCGKTTQAKAVAEKFSALNIDHIYVREPGGTSISEAIREMLLDNMNDKMHASTELLLYAAARAQIVEQVIAPALKEDNAVICDRYADSTTAYQGYGRQLDLKLVNAAINLATNGLQADLTLFFNVSLLSAATRRNASGKNDRLEAEKNDFHSRVQEGYLRLAEENKQRFVCIDAEKSIESQYQTVWKIVRARAIDSGFKPEAFL